jgi:hypothetical protein
MKAQLFLASMLACALPHAGAAGCPYENDSTIHAMVVKPGGPKNCHRFPFLGFRVDCNVEVEVVTYIGNDSKEHCCTRVEVGEIGVNRGEHLIALEWDLSPDRQDVLNPNKYKYAFVPKSGIGILDRFDSDDLDSGDVLDAGKTTFRWRSVNKATKTFRYQVNVERESAPGQPPLQCDANDPTIVNHGN